MELIKIISLVDKNNDRHVLYRFIDGFMVNDNYDGLNIIDNNLTVIQKIRFPEEFSVDIIFSKFNNKEIILQTLDDGSTLYVSLVSKITKIIEKNVFNEVFFPIYYWEKDLIVGTYGHSFYMFDSKNYIFTLIASNDVRDTYPDFYNFWQQVYQLGLVLDADSKELWVVYLDENRRMVGYYNYGKKIHKTSSLPDDCYYHFVTYLDGIWVFVNEKKIIIQKDEQILKIVASNIYTRYNSVCIKKIAEVYYVYVLAFKSNQSKDTCVVKYKLLV